ncbi:MAG: maleylpyruvate isomerase N-terminal domain-containing protein [Actinobacteria bacterium]|nr:maleylpyruvate isomerase N-terminal domain-containing protein [Actinomycetota bacterium]
MKNVDPAMKTVERDIRGATAAHRLLFAAVAKLTDDDVRSASLLPDWTVAHVIAHIARNADSHVLMIEAAERGEVGDQYPGGVDQRNADIAAGAQLSAAELIDDVATAVDRLHAAWATTTATGWAGTGRTVVGAVSMKLLPFRRWREAEIHHADLGLAYSWRDWSAEYVRLELQQMTMLWASRQPMGLTALPDEAFGVDERHRLAWLVGRATIEGLAPAGIY